MQNLAHLALIAVLAAAVVEATVMGVDLGSEFIKIAAPKGDQIDIVLNEQTRRKSNNFVGFRGTDRYLGEDAKNLAPRFPLNMIPMVNRLLGVPFDSEERRGFNDKLYHSHILVSNPKRDTVDIAIPKNPNVTYTVEEIMAMLVSYVKDMTEKDTERNMTSAVFTVPVFYTHKQRQALVDAAEMAGIKTLALMHSTTAAALQHGMNRRGFGNQTVNVLVFDMGATKTEVGVYTFSPTPKPKEGRVKLAVSLGTMKTRAIVSDPNLGGKSFDACLARHFEDEFIEKNPKAKRVLGGETLQQQKAAFSLMRAANSAKERLSANSVTPVTVEGMAPDRDFVTKISRETFEEKCGDLFARAVQIAKDAVAESGVALEDISAFELMGGGPRPPKIVSELSAYIGRPVDRTLNSDEAAAMGAGYYGTCLASYFRVKSFAIEDILPETIAFELDPPPAGKSFSSRRALFESGQLDSRRSITVSRKEDFRIKLFSSRDGKTFSEYSTIAISDVNETLDRLGFHEPKIPHENNTAAIRIQLHLQNTGIVNIEEATAKFRYVANISKRVKVNITEETPEQKEDSEPDNAKEKSAEGEKTPESAEGAEGSDANATASEEGDNATATKKPQFKYETVFSLEMRRKTSGLKDSTSSGSPLSMDQDDKWGSKATLRALDEADALKRATATSKNDLETYIQWAKYDGIIDNAELRTLNFINDEEEASIKQMLAESQEWLEDGEGSYDSATKEEFDAKLEEVKKGAAVVMDRYQEHLDKIAEAKRNATLAKEKAARTAKKAAKKKAAEEAKKQKEAEEAAKREAEESKEESQEGQDESANDEKTPENEL